MIEGPCSHGNVRPLVISGRTAVQTLQQEIQRSEESRYDPRLHGVLLVVGGGRRVYHFGGLWSAGPRPDDGGQWRTIGELVSGEEPGGERDRAPMPESAIRQA